MRMGLYILYMQCGQVIVIENVEGKRTTPFVVAFSVRRGQKVCEPAFFLEYLLFLFMCICVNNAHPSSFFKKNDSLVYIKYAHTILFIVYYFYY